MERFVEHPSEFVRGPTQIGPEVRTSDVSDEERVSCQDGQRGFGGPFQVVDQDRDRFGSVTRGLYRPEPHATELQRLVLGQGRERVLGVCLRAQPDGRSHRFSKFQVARHEIGVKMGEDGVADLHTMSAGFLLVPGDVPLGVYDCGDAGLLVSYEVGSMGQIRFKMLFEDHPLFFIPAHQMSSGLALPRADLSTARMFQRWMLRLPFPGFRSPVTLGSDHPRRMD